MFKIQYYEDINKIDINNLNEWIIDFIDNNKEKLYKEKIVLAACENYNIVLSKDVKEYYSLSVLQDKNCYMKHYFKEQDFNEFKDEFMAQYFMLRKVSKGEILNIVECKSNDNINKFKVNYNTRDISNPTKQFQATPIVNKKMKVLDCNNCVYIEVIDDIKHSLKCVKRNCRIYDKTEATWCKYYKIGG